MSTTFVPDCSTSGFEARLCHLIFYFFGIECCYSTKISATATHPTLLWAPIFHQHQQEDEDNGFTFFNAGGLRRVSEFSLRKKAWRNPKEGRVGCLHQDIFTRKVTDIAFTSDFCNNYSHSASPASPYLTSLRSRSTRPRVPHLMSSSPSSRVPNSQVPTHASLCPRPLVPVPLLYTAEIFAQCAENMSFADAYCPNLSNTQSNSARFGWWGAHLKPNT